MTLWALLGRTTRACAQEINGMIAAERARVLQEVELAQQRADVIRTKPSQSVRCRRRV